MDDVVLSALVALEPAPTARCEQLPECDASARFLVWSAHDQEHSESVTYSCAACLSVAAAVWTTVALLGAHCACGAPFAAGDDVHRWFRWMAL